MTDLLGIGASGVRAYQSALTTVSENIVNAGTAGYARRTTDLNEVMAGLGGVSQPLIAEGNGVIVAGVTRSADAFRVADVREANADLSRTETSVAWLGRIEGALSGNALDQELTRFFNTANAVAVDPTAITPRAVMIETASAAAGAFVSTGNALDRIGADLDATAQAAVDSLGRLGVALAQVNKGLGQVAPRTSVIAQLTDQRDQLLEQISAISDAAVTIDAVGRATVRLGGPSGPVFVTGVEAGLVSYARVAGAVSFAVSRAGTNAALTPSGGVLAGIVEGAQRLTGAREQLTAIAADFVDGVNAVQAQGRDLDGNPGAPLFATGAAAFEVTVALADPRGLAAAAVGGGPRDNSNLQALNALRGSGAFEARTTAMVAGNAATLAARRHVAEAQAAIRHGAVVARDSVSGVNLDSEAVDLMRFQQAYQASTRVIQAARETIQSILDLR